MSYKLARQSFAALRFVLLAAIAVTVIYPLLWVFLGSFKTEKEFFLNPWGIPSALHFEIYTNVIKQYRLDINIWNSFLIGLLSTIIITLVSALAAYGIIRMKWSGSKWMLGFFLLGIMIPVHSTLIPLYISLQGLREWIDPRLVLLIPYVAFGIPTSILILSGYVSTLSKEIEEAAVMDGSSLIGVFFRIILPVSVPALATVGILSFIHAWNELLYALVFLRDTAEQTIPVAILKFVGFYSTDWSNVFACISITIIPSVIIYVFLQEKIVQGVTSGAVKH
ncbi:carbohydrate ABC transporter permease [Paenibacillus cremeus]|uniref:Carbohydrate ABC transporter permease n=1 Tax=Paenibacillus cremeus TaxID=2163881 RepID=A0A559JHQ5_9BACL|nr:carbohydrate ABC transporter permease [Paenibacillus cremeus]TVX99387.1 carbohydrate ABC transporter permease [Paenibacillus cremeus]